MKKLILLSMLALTGCFGSKYSIGNCFITNTPIGQIAGQITSVDKELYHANIYIFGQGPIDATRPIKDMDQDEKSEKIDCKVLGL